MREYKMITVCVTMVDGRKFYMYKYMGEIKSNDHERKTFPEDLPEICKWLNKYSSYDSIEIKSVI